MRVFFMPTFYKNQGMVEKLSVKTGVASYRLSEQRKILFGGRGSKYDELVYLRKQNTDAVGVNRSNNDGWVKFGVANGSNGTRTDEIQHTFTKNGTFA